MDRFPAGLPIGQLVARRDDVLMTIPARQIPKFLVVSTGVSVRTESGNPSFVAQRPQIEAMILADTIIGVVRGKNLKYVRLLVPPDLCYRRRGAPISNRHRRIIKSLPLAECNITWKRVGPTTFHPHWRHCAAYGALRASEAERMALALMVEA